MTFGQKRRWLRACAHRLHASRRERGVVPKDVEWPQVPKMSRRRYIRQAKEIYLAVMAAA